MSHELADRDVQKVYAGYVSWNKEFVVHINYWADTASTYYTREDLEYMLRVLDGLEEGVQLK